MAMRVLQARETATEYVFVILLDDSRVNKGGTPDPAYVREYRWAVTPPDTGKLLAAPTVEEPERMVKERVSAADYLAQIQRDLAGLCAVELEALAPGKALPLEGKTL